MNSTSKTTSWLVGYLLSALASAWVWVWYSYLFCHNSITYWQWVCIMAIYGVLDFIFKPKLIRQALLALLVIAILIQLLAWIGIVTVPLFGGK